MIEITCTEDEQNDLIQLLCMASKECDCLFYKDIYLQCKYHCFNCLETNIKWNIRKETNK